MIGNTMRHRKPHRKSRDGCRLCKKRKIKCDEGKPRCTNCVKSRVTCSFDHQSSARESSSPVAPLNEEPSTPVKRRRGRPRKDWKLPAQELGPNKWRMKLGVVPWTSSSLSIQDRRLRQPPILVAWI
ncbi:hypothetical protein BDV12DRAFT_123298 [Aspergillus spectabilis]